MPLPLVVGTLETEPARALATSRLWWGLLSPAPSPPPDLLGLARTQVLTRSPSLGGDSNPMLQITSENDPAIRHLSGMQRHLPALWACGDLALGGAVKGGGVRTGGGTDAASMNRCGHISWRVCQTCSHNGSVHCKKDRS